jgi:hypothetical protein
MPKSHIMLSVAALDPSFATVKLSATLSSNGGEMVERASQSWRGENSEPAQEREGRTYSGQPRNSIFDVSGSVR